MDDAEAQEALERRLAELEFVSSAYAPNEAWLDEGFAPRSRVCRRLLLPQVDFANKKCGCIEVCLALTMPDGYPVREDATLDISATIESSSVTMRKEVLNALPNLIESCRAIALECAGSEAVFSVLAQADEWVSEKWPQIRLKKQHIFACNEECIKGNDDAISGKGEVAVLGRRLIYSHHIIAQSKRKAIVDLANHYNLGGYFKIGWPGIIIIEGDEEDCLSYVDDIRGMRWQHLVVRGEQQVPVKDIGELRSARVFLDRMVELGVHQMSTLAEICRKAGIEDLFLTSMKIYRDGTDTNKENSCVQEEEESSSGWQYGAFIHVDHMNDGKGYRKWLRKASNSASCDLLLKQCYPDKNLNTQPIIVVGIMGEKDDVRRVLKRWRTSRVDVDSRGTPCLERMMTVLIEGSLHQQGGQAEAQSTFLTLDAENELTVDEEPLGDILNYIGGPDWANAFINLLR